MAAIVSPPIEWIDPDSGRRFGKIVAVQADAVSAVAVADEFFVPLPFFCKTAIFECALTGAGTAVSLRPQIGFSAAFVKNGAGFMKEATAADANHRITDMVYTPEGLYVRPTPDVDLDGTQVITTTVRYIVGE